VTAFQSISLGADAQEYNTIKNPWYHLPLSTHVDTNAGCSQISLYHLFRLKHCHYFPYFISSFWARAASASPSSLLHTVRGERWPLRARTSPSFWNCVLLVHLARSGTDYLILRLEFYIIFLFPRLFDGLSDIFSAPEKAIPNRI